MKNVLLFLLILFTITVTALWARHGGGKPYPDLTRTPQLHSDVLEEVLAYSEPIGNVAVNQHGRVFFTVHPESRPSGNKLLEYVNGAAVPFPSLQLQNELFDTPLGLAIDRLDRLWVIDHGNHGLRPARIVAIDLATGDVLRNQPLDASVAPLGSMLQDLQVSVDGNTLIIADTSFWRKSPALIVYDVQSGDARRVLQGHASVSAEHYKIRTQSRQMEFLGGLVALRGGVDGIALDAKWLYYGALNGSGLFKVPLSALADKTLPQAELERLVERHSDKPLSDGLSVDVSGAIFITDVEHNAIFKVDPDGRLTTVIRSPRLRWPDALSYGPDAYLYVADSALADVMLKPAQHIRENGPYRIFRFQPGSAGNPGQ